MTDKLRSKLIRLAASNPELRSDLLPLLRGAGSFSPRDKYNPSVMDPALVRKVNDAFVRAGLDGSKRFGSAREAFEAAVRVLEDPRVFEMSTMTEKLTASDGSTAKLSNPSGRLRLGLEASVKVYGRSVRPSPPVRVKNAELRFDWDPGNSGTTAEARLT